MTRILLIAALLVVSCAKGTQGNPVFPPGVSPTPLPQPLYVGIGKYQRLGETVEASTQGVPYVTFLEVRQAVGATILHRDVPGFVYSAKGTHLLSRDDGERLKTVVEGAAAWVDAGTEHQNPGAPDGVWYFVSLRSINQRDGSFPFPTYRLVYASADLPTPRAGKPLVHQLALITMDPGGRTSSHSHAGSETFYVLQGTVELALNNGTRTKITEGEGGFVKPGLVMQMRVIGDAPVAILTYFVTPEGEPWQTNLETLP
jgi:quercetin dioxygenase-like cupin family protein